MSIPERRNCKTILPVQLVGLEFQQVWVTLDACHTKSLRTQLWFPAVCGLDGRAWLHASRIRLRLQFGIPRSAGHIKSHICAAAIDSNACIYPKKADSDLCKAACGQTWRAPLAAGGCCYKECKVSSVVMICAAVSTPGVHRIDTQGGERACARRQRQKERETFDFEIAEPVMVPSAAGRQESRLDPA